MSFVMNALWYVSLSMFMSLDLANKNSFCFLYETNQATMGHGLHKYDLFSNDGGLVECSKIPV